MAIVFAEAYILVCCGGLGVQTRGKVMPKFPEQAGYMYVIKIQNPTTVHWFSRSGCCLLFQDKIDGWKRGNFVSWSRCSKCLSMQVLWPAVGGYSGRCNSCAVRGETDGLYAIPARTVWVVPYEYILRWQH